MRWSSQRSLKFDGSGNPVVFSVAAVSGWVCRVSGTTVTYTASGRCAIDANQAGDGSYAAAPHVQQTVIVVDIPRNSGVSRVIRSYAAAVGHAARTVPSAWIPA